MKKITLLLICLLSALNISAEVYSGSCGENANYSLDTETGVLSITGTGAMTNYGSSSSVPWYKHRSLIKTVEIADDITSIGGSAFSGCSGLTSIEIPSSVTSIGSGAFGGCSGLTSIEIPNSVTSIEWSAFSNCSGLTSIKIPNSVTSIRDYVFSGCSGLTSIDIPNSVTSIREKAFYNCSGLTSIDIPNSVTSIGGYAFSGCSSLTSVHITDIAAWCKISFNGSDANPLSYAHHLFMNGKEIKDLVIPSNVTEIENIAFYGCSELTSVTIPNSVTSIGNYAFSGCTGLTKVTLNSNAIVSKTYSYDSSSLKNYFGTQVKEYILGDSVTSIGSYAFYGCSDLTSIEIPNSVTTIGSSAFSGCSDLTSITIGSGVTEIGSSVFYDCSNLTKVELNCNTIVSKSYSSGSSLSRFFWGTQVKEYILGDSITSIGDYAFYNYSSLTSIIIGSGITSIGNNAFYGCSGLISVEIPNSITSIGEKAFYVCKGLTSVTIPSSVTSIGKGAFSGCSALTKVELNSNVFASTPYLKNFFGTQVKEYILGDSVTSIGNYAFESCSALTSIEIPNSVTTIGNYAFFGCSNLTSIEIPNSVTTIGDYAFSGCSGLTSIEIPNSVTTIGSSAFYGCSDLTSVTIGNSVTSIGHQAFSGCSGLISIEIPNSVTLIGNFAFKGCSDLTSVTIGNSVTSIGDYAFQNCTALTSIEIPNSMTKIGSSAFDNCSNLVTVTINSNSCVSKSFFGNQVTKYIIGDDVTEIGKNAFNYCTMLDAVTIGKGVNKIAENAFYSCYLEIQNFINNSSLNAEANNYWGATILDSKEDGFYIKDGTLIKYIGDETTVTIPNNVTSIGESVFYGRSSLTSVTIPSNVTSIGNSAFNGCSGLTSVIIPNSVTTIGESAFSKCSGLTEVTIPNSVTSIGSGAFSSCSSLKSISVESGSPNYDSRDNCNAIIETATNNLIQGCQNTVVPNSVTSIGSSAFYGCSGLTEVIIPNSVTSIGYQAFYGCSNLNKVISYIKNPSRISAFDSEVLETAILVIPYSSLNLYKNVRGWTFQNVEQMEGTIEETTFIEFADALTKSACCSRWDINKDGEISLDEVKKVMVVPASMFSSNSMVSFDELKYFTNITTIESSAFNNCTKLKSITLPEKLTTIGSYAFYNCSSLTSVEIPNSVTSIGNNAFQDCSGLTSMTIPNSVTMIGNYAFYGCSGLTSIEIPNSVTTIGNYAFSGCSGLTSVTIGSGVTTIGNNAFEYCSQLTDIYCYAENVPTTSGSFNSIILHVPEASLTSYHATAPWKDGFIVAIGSDVDIEIYSTKAPNFTLYYDYDGDGIMEYFGSGNSSGNNNLGIYDYKGQLLQESKYTKGIPINGNGDILFYKDYSTNSSTYSVEGIEEAICTIADIDNDGRKDLVVDPSISSNQEGHFTIYYQQPDGTFQPTEQLWTKDAEAAMVKGSSGGVAFLRSFLTAGMFVDARKAHFSSWNNDESDNMARSVTRSVQAISSVDGSYRTLDMNYDGINDLLTSGNSSTVLYSYADNKFYVSYKKGGLYPCDLNGDSELDFISYDGNSITLMTRTGGETYDEKTLFTNSSVKQIIYKDFDHDGDIDILAYINSSAYGTLGPTYFVFFRNDGDMSFKRRERNFADSYLLEEIKDVDADGLYEMLVYDQTNRQVRLFKIGTDMALTEKTDIDFGNVNSSYPIAVGDYDNDGLVDYRYAVKSSAILCGRFSQAVNTAPERMSAPTALLDADTQRLRINWKQGSDTETSSCDLTYELRIGTEPASGDVLFGASLADGTRRTFEEGNMGRSLSTLFNAKSLKPGKYYISVQAVDGGGRGGAWSEDFVYEHQLAAPVIVSNFTSQMTSADTIRLSVKAPIDGAEYKWTVSEGRQIESDGDDTRYIFERDGKHTVNLSMTYDGRTLNASPLELVVTPAKKYSGSNPSCGFVDFNQDGYPEYLGYVNDGQGNLEKVLLSYATQYYGNYNTNVLDFNMDGYPDVWCSDNVLINLGEQDNDFDVTTEEIDEGCSGYYGSLIFDANNDGYLDTPDGYNNGTNRGWMNYNFTDSKYAIYDSKGRVTNLNNSYGYYELGSPNYDVNRDGMLDIVTVVREYGSNNRRWYVMYKDSTANMNYTTPQLMYEIDGYYDALRLEDMNNDGYVDILIRDEYTRELTIVKGCATLPYKETIITKEEVSDSYSMHDYNNDGYIDIHWYNKLIKFGPDFVEEVMEGVLLPKYGRYDYNYFMVQKDGGYPDKYESHIKNLPPSAPATVAAKQTKDGMLITWSDAQDDHTPAMQMRYNISVKRKGKRGDNSFVISPLNGLKDAATICGNVMYKKSTQMLVPASVLTAGETYEIQVQAIDLWNQHSPMTKAIEFTMTSSGYVDVAEKVAVGKETVVKFVGTQSGNYSLSAGTDATIVSNNGNGEFIVKWSSEGIKELVLTAGTKTIKSSVTVVKPVDLTFTVPEQVYANAPLTVAVSEEMASEPKNVGMRVTGNSKIKVEYSVGSKIATVTFPSTGIYELEAYSTDSIRGNSYKQTVNVTRSMLEPAIEQVGVDAETGYYAISWDAATLPSDISKVIISKEGTTTDIFSAIDTVDVEDGRFIDKSSNPVVQTSRYTIRLVADNGQISENSLPHKPLHVMLIKGVVGYNLIWNSYEGLKVQGYSILRGSSPDNMEPIAQVAGSINNYTDITAPSGINYYAVTIQNGTSQKARSASREVTDISYEAISSNVISTESAIEGVSAKSIEIVTLDDDKTLNDEHKELQLYTLILPTYSTVSTVKWEITEGKSLASIDNNGMLHGKGGTGNVTVQARTIDESNLSAEISIPVSIKNTVLRGDVNGDGNVDMDDVTFVTNIILGIEYATEAADVNNDGSVNMADVMFIVNYIKNGNFPDE